MSVCFMGIGCLATPSIALASAGCDAVNSGGFNRSLPGGMGEYSTDPYDFTAGDTLSFTISRVSAPGSDGAVFSLTDQNDQSVPLIRLGGNRPSESASYIVPAPGLQIFMGLTSYGSSITVSASCTPSGPSDSDKLRSVQIQGTRIVAQTSGAAIAGAVDQALGRAFDAGAPAGTATGPGTGVGGAPSNLGGPRRSESGSPASSSDNGTATFSRRGPNWNAWGDLRFAQSQRASDSGGFEGSQANGTFGVDRIVAPGLAVGVLGGVEHFGYDFASLSGRLSGHGTTVGAYLGWKLLPALRFDATGSYSRIAYVASAGLATGEFFGDRWLFSSGLTGSHTVAGFKFEPSVRVLGIWERQNAYQDSLGNTQDVNTLRAGRTSVGSRVSRLVEIAPGLSFAPYAGLYADRHLAGETSVPAGTEVLGFRDGWSARALAGIGAQFGEGVSLSVGGEWAGIGTDMHQRTLNVRGAVRF